MNNTYRKNVLWIIFNKEWKILVWKYNSSKPNWTFPKWWIEENETVESSIFREIYEELWINSNLEIVYKYDKEYIINFSKKEIERKKLNKWEYFTWKKEKIILIKFFWTEYDIDLTISNGFSEYKYISIDEIENYISDNKLLDFIDLNFLNNIIKENTNV